MLLGGDRKSKEHFEIGRFGKMFWGECVREVKGSIWIKEEGEMCYGDGKGNP